MEASTKLAGARPAALASAARFFTDVGAPGAKRAARKLYERALQRDPDHAPSLQVARAPQPLSQSQERARSGIRTMCIHLSKSSGPLLTLELDMVPPPAQGGAVTCFIS